MSANWPCPPLCRLKRECCCGAAADRLLVGHRGALADDRQVVAVAQPVERDLQMDVALAPQHHLARCRRSARAASVGSSSISLAIDAGQLDVVAALFGVRSRGRRPAAAAPAAAAARPCPTGSAPCRSRSPPCGPAPTTSPDLARRRPSPAARRSAARRRRRARRSAHCLRRPCRARRATSDSLPVCGRW